METITVQSAETDAILMLAVVRRDDGTVGLVPADNLTADDVLDVRADSLDEAIELLDGQGWHVVPAED